MLKTHQIIKFQFAEKKLCIAQYPIILFYFIYLFFALELRSRCELKYALSQHDEKHLNKIYKHQILWKEFCNMELWHSIIIISNKNSHKNSYILRIMMDCS